MLRDVQLGREWVITERGKPIARLVPVSASRGPLTERLRRLEELGVVERRAGTHLPLPPPLPLADEFARRILDEDRERWHRASERRLLGHLGHHLSSFSRSLF